MGLKLTNKATIRQQQILAELEYIGQGKYAAVNLTVEEAAKIIDELFAEKKYTTGQIREIAADYYNMPIVDVAGMQPEDIEDPFSEYNGRRKL